ncbi:GIY-YIG nuclease family protein [Candidatus Binatus sp.]|uniref:GIY-YIG nuclease family protein n=1 Tax=Candidatus Binatus sp. TaxID=2811406 RepID=UPI00351D5168
MRKRPRSLPEPAAKSESPHSCATEFRLVRFPQVSKAARSYFVYILSSPSRTLYVGVTNSLERRVFEHKDKAVRGFTARYNISRLVYFEEFSDPGSAISREKEIRAGGGRKR